MKRKNESELPYDNGQSQQCKRRRRMMTTGLSPEQVQIYNFVMDNPHRSVFITGDAGTGKSYLLAKLIPALRIRYGSTGVAVTASTGVAATEFRGGTTLHAFAGCGTTGNSYAMWNSVRTSGAIERWKNVRVLIINEISMVSGEFLDQLDQIARRAREKRDTPFGGIVLILCGDFFQLPPVSDDKDKKKRTYAFDAKVWQQLDIRVFQLKHSHRHANDPFLTRILPEVRRGRIPPEVEQALLQCVGRSFPEGSLATRIMPRNSQVDEINRNFLMALDGETYEFLAIDVIRMTGETIIGQNGDKNPCRRLMAQAVLQLKIGAQVMLIRNLNVTGGLVNGLIGRVVGFVEEGEKEDGINPSEEASAPDIREQVAQLFESIIRGRLDRGKARPIREDIISSDAGRVTKRVYRADRAPSIEVDFGKHGRVTISPCEWTVCAPGRQGGYQELATRTQIPLKLAYAITVHKSQGMTISTPVIANCTEIFEPGQFYTMLSRICKIDQLSLDKMPPSLAKVLFADRRVVEFYENASTAESGGGGGAVDEFYEQYII